MVKAEGPDYFYVKGLQYTKNQPVCVSERAPGKTGRWRHLGFLEVNAESSQEWLCNNVCVCVCHRGHEAKQADGDLWE